MTFRLFDIQVSSNKNHTGGVSAGHITVLVRLRWTSGLVDPGSRIKISIGIHTKIFVNSLKKDLFNSKEFSDITSGVNP